MDENADEGLKHIVHEAGYKAYEFTNTILAYVWWAAVIYTAASDIDFVLIGLISFIWILHLGKFMYEMQRKNDLLRGEKGGYFKKASWLNDSGANSVHFIRSNPNWEIRSNFELMGNSWNFIVSVSHS